MSAPEHETSRPKKESSWLLALLISLAVGAVVLGLLLPLLEKQKREVNQRLNDLEERIQKLEK